MARTDLRMLTQLYQLLVEKHLNCACIEHNSQYYKQQPENNRNRNEFPSVEWQSIVARAVERAIKQTAAFLGI